jgi:hypothetical protein
MNETINILKENYKKIRKHLENSTITENVNKITENLNEKSNALSKHIRN